MSTENSRAKARIFAALTLGISLAAGGCGFHLEGLGTLPSAMNKTYLQTSRPSSEFFGSLREVLRRRGLEIVSDPEEAGATLVITDDSTGQRVLSVSARNIPREYEIYYTVTFSLQAGTEPLIEPESLVLTRSYTYDETQVLGKSQEEKVLREALAEDLAMQVVRRIEANASVAAVPAG